MPKVFLSYRRDDSEGHAGRIWDRLSAKFGKQNVFMDVDSIGAGVDFLVALTSALNESSAMVAVIGDSWTGLRPDGTHRLRDDGDFVRREVAAALKMGIRVVPVLVGGTQMPSLDVLPDDLHGFVFLNASEIRHRRFDSDVAALIDTVEAILDAADAQRRRAPSPEVQALLRQRLGEPRGIGSILLDRAWLK